MTNFTPVLNLKDLPVGKMKKVEVGEEEVLLVNVDGNIYAVDDRCGHMNASLSCGELADSELECPLHGAIFDIKTGKLIAEEPRKSFFKKFKKDVDDLLAVLGIPPVKIKGLKTYPVQVKDGVIMISVEDTKTCCKDTK